MKTHGVYLQILKIMAALDSGLGPRGFGPGEFSKRSVAA